ncbi:MAG: RIP metalloprotease RseP [Planctomycetota bacterium]|jgi:regulator of sigma E protease|nr:RIP metalloprotease RseP [Planctomycetota bacterium]MDP6764048.1 RIP metalloprotease RseP [Planctomycetota bacterium]MDP6989947.1 RIP metalloprotease RseP [Planctomycetota bacterium]
MLHQLQSAWVILEVVLGVGLVIFVHELGHFLAARACGVRVDVFSIGFGPRLFGWRRGATLYQVAAVPLGGYVRMAGEEPDGEGREPRPDELRAQSVGGRFLIFSGGVIANVVFGLVVFPILFAIGVPFHAPLLGAAPPGSPVWHAGLPEGTRVLSVNDSDVHDFTDIHLEVALSGAEPCDLEVLEPGAAHSRVVRLTPEYDARLGFSTIGVSSPSDLEHHLAIEPGSPAAESGLRTGDRLLAVSGGTSGRSLRAQVDAVLVRQEPLAGRFERDGQAFDAVVSPRLEQAGEPLFGVSTPFNHLSDLRATPLVGTLDLARGDRILSVGDAPILRRGDLLDALLAHPGGAPCRIERAGSAVALDLPALPPPDAVALAADLALSNDLETTRLTIAPGGAGAEAGLLDGDRILTIDGAEVSGFEDIRRMVSAAVAEERSMVVLVERPGVGDAEPTFPSFEVRPAPRVEATYGLALQPPTYVLRAENPLEAARLGVGACWKFVEQALLMLKGIAGREVSGKTVGGIITIGVAAHDFALAGNVKLLFFLCILSMNLAFLNILPIPLLDGGHLLFLVIEKLKGSPVSERIMSYSQLVGLVFIVTLFLYVIYNDLQRVIS